jgi:glucosamine--fructose-6-phosphate aminotransferase (isomerizing)
VWALTPLTPIQVQAVEATGATVRQAARDPQAELVAVQRHAVSWAAAAGRDADVPTHLTRSVVEL